MRWKEISFSKKICGILKKYTKHGIKLGKKHSQKNYAIMNLVEHIDKLSDNRGSLIPV